MLPSLVRAKEWTDAGVEVTLIDPQQWLYYSGMVPEYLGGVYTLDDIRIDLDRWARRGGVTHVRDRATALDPEARVVSTAEGDEYPFDVLAIDVGGVNPFVPEAAVATKPISRIRALAPHLERVLEVPAAALHLAVVGGGAAGVEVSLNVTGRFQAVGRLADLDLTIVEQEDPILPGFPEGMRRYAACLLRRRGGTSAPQRRSRRSLLPRGRVGGSGRRPIVVRPQRSAPTCCCGRPGRWGPRGSGRAASRRMSAGSCASREGCEIPRTPEFSPPGTVPRFRICPSRRWASTR